MKVKSPSITPVYQLCPNLLDFLCNDVKHLTYRTIRKEEDKMFFYLLLKNNFVMTCLNN